MKVGELLSLVLGVIAITLIASAEYKIPQAYFFPTAFIVLNTVTVTLNAMNLMRSLGNP